MKHLRRNFLWKFFTAKNFYFRKQFHHRRLIASKVRVWLLTFHFHANIFPFLSGSISNNTFISPLVWYIHWGDSKRWCIAYNFTIFQPSIFHWMWFSNCLTWKSTESALFKITGDVELISGGSISKKWISKQRRMYDCCNIQDGTLCDNS